MAKLGSINLALKDGILHADVLDDLTFRLKDLIFFYYFTREITEQKPYSVLYDLRNSYVKATDEVLELMAHSKWINKHKKAEAILVKSLPNLIRAKFYVRSMNPITPTQIFRSEKKAIRWLKQMDPSMHQSFQLTEVRLPEYNVLGI